MKCNNCGKEILEDSAFCSFCGSKVVRERYCSKCGVKLAQGAAFCHKCGTAQQSAPEPAPAPKPAAPVLPENPLEDKLAPRVFKREYLSDYSMGLFNSLNRVGGIRVNGDWVMYVRDNVICWTSCDGKRRGTVPYETEQEIQLIGFNNEGIWIIDGNEMYIDRKLVVLDINGGVLYEKTNPNDHMLDAGKTDVCGREYMYYDELSNEINIGSMDSGQETQAYYGGRFSGTSVCSMSFNQDYIFFKKDQGDWYWLSRLDKSGKTGGEMVKGESIEYLLMEKDRMWVKRTELDDETGKYAYVMYECKMGVSPSKQPAFRSVKEEYFKNNEYGASVYFDGDRSVDLVAALTDDSENVYSLRRTGPGGEDVSMSNPDKFNSCGKYKALATDKLIVADYDGSGFAIYPRNFSAFTGKASDNPEAVPLYGEWE